MIAYAVTVPFASLIPDGWQGLHTLVLGVALIGVGRVLVGLVDPTDDPVQKSHRGQSPTPRTRYPPRRVL